MVKTPEEIKKGLAMCNIWMIDEPNHCHKGCPYFCTKDCADALMKDALAYSQQLEAKCHQLERERDAAVADLAETKDCITCKHSANCKIGGFDCYHCNDKDCPCLTCQYEWRGVKEDSHE